MRTAFWIAALCVGAVGWMPPTVAADESSADANRHFALKVFPVLKEKCFACHGDDPADLRGDLDMRTLDGLLTGGETGEPSIHVGDPEESEMVWAIRRESNPMPPKDNDALTEQQVDAIVRWIADGAVWPSEATRREIEKQEREKPITDDGVLVRTSGGTSDQWTFRRYQPDDLWAWQPVPPSSSFGLSIDGGHPIDQFIQDQLDSRSLQAADLADPQTLIRRATFDVLGLPPTREEVADFLSQWRQDPDSAWTALIDRLLASPHYGERAAQHWFDVARYADTGGMSNDYERSNMWRYRDYVIRSFNDDLPYDQFVMEQIAGDELANRSVLERSGGDPEAVIAAQYEGDYTPEEARWLVATGYLRLGPWDTAMIAEDEARQIYLDDLTNIIGQTFLSTTMRCVKCHDHKFDPIPTRDYYRMYSALATTHPVERRVPFLDRENQAGFDQGRAHVQRMLDFAKQEVDRLVGKREAAARQWFEEHNLPYKNEQARKNLDDELKPPRHVGLTHVEQGQLKVREQDVWIWNRRLERYQPMAQSVYSAGAVKIRYPGARNLRIDKRDDRETKPKNFILTGGALTATGDPVGPGVLSATGVAIGDDPTDLYRIDDAVQGRRLALARWIANPNNPLSTRSIVNRVWQQHFGRGLAANPNNFGGKGAKPSHPELLDYLTADFVENGWTLKRLHRLILTSQTYRRSSVATDPHVGTEDPGNRWLSYFPKRRLTAEEIRDAMLRITGEWNPAIGGLPVMPEINMEVALQPRMIQFSLAPAYQPSRLPSERNRRTIYAYRVRGQADPFLELFNQPNPNESCELRDDAAVTPQALTLLNSEVMSDRSLALADRLIDQHAETEARVVAAFRRVLGRDPQSDERDRMVRYVRDMDAYHRDVRPSRSQYPTKITRSLVEEFTGKPFEYVEILPRFENYVPDLKPADADPETRALADLCLLLLNTNEFMYLR